jgi:hypothetical protein
MPTWISNLFPSAVWAIAVVLLFLIFRRPISGFLEGMNEFRAPGVSARRGDLTAAKIRNGVDAIGTLEVPIASTEGSESPSTSQNLSAAESIVAFLGRMARYRLKKLAEQARETATHAEAMMIVDAAYDELLVFVRGLELSQQLQSSNDLIIPRYSGTYSFKSLEKLGAPAPLADSLEEVQTFKHRVTSKEIVVSPDGAQTYAATALDLLLKIYAWYTNTEPGITLPLMNDMIE